MESNDLLCETRTYTRNTHKHQHFHSQLILPLQGSLSIKTDRYELDLDDKHLFYLPPRCHHSYSANSTNKFLIVDIPEAGAVITSASSLRSELHSILDDRWKAVRYLLQEEAKRNDAVALRALVSYAVSFLVECEKPASMQYIHDNIGNHISIEKLADIEKFNISYYIEWFSKKTGMTPNAYIQMLRLQRAKEYLTNTEMSLLEISYLIGYKQQSSLTRLFKIHNELPPKDYRRTSRKTGK